MILTLLLYVGKAIYTCIGWNKLYEFVSSLYLCGGWVPIYAIVQWKQLKWIFFVGKNSKEKFSGQYLTEMEYDVGYVESENVEQGNVGLCI